MSEMSGIVEQQLQQQYSAGIDSAADKFCCKDCGMNFDSSSSLEVHLRYHQDNLMSQWASQQNPGEESNNNNNKAGNHNSAGGSSVHVNVTPAKHDCGPPQSDSRGSLATSPAAQSAEQQQISQQNQEFGNFTTSLQAFNESFFVYDEHAHIMSGNAFSASQTESAAGPQRTHMSYARFNPYQHAAQQHYASANSASANAPSPRNPLQCEKCGTVCENPNQLMEHVSSAHGTSPSANSYSAPPQNSQQYQQLAGSPQHLAAAQSSQMQVQQQQQQQQQQMINASPPAQLQQQMMMMPQRQTTQATYDYSNNPVMKAEKVEPEEQAEILDLDSHKVQTHRYEEQLRRIQQNNMQHADMHMASSHQQAMQQHQPAGASLPPVNSMMNWPAVSQPHDYHGCISPMGPMDSMAPMQEQPSHPYAMRNIAPVETPMHPGSPNVANQQALPSAPIPNVLMPQSNPRGSGLGNQSWKSNEARRPKTYNCTACNKWFTSSGHLKRHYNTTLHKNAVKQSNRPDPANLPISVHHHPGRDSNTSRNANNRTSPETQSSSPPNLMAGPSGEATRGLLQPPINSSFNNSNNNSNSSSNSSSTVSSSLVSADPNLSSKVNEQQQQQQQQQQQATQQSPQASPMLQPLASPEYHHTQVASPMAQQQQQQHQILPQAAMGFLPVSSGLLLSHDQQQLQMGTFSQIGAPSHQVIPSDHIYMQAPVVHANTPTLQHTMESTSPMLPTMAATASSPAGSLMGGTMMPHQLYPNEQPPHVFSLTKTTQLIGNGNLSIHQSDNREMLPGFDIFNNPQQLLSFHSNKGFIVHSQTANVGGLSSESLNSQNSPFESQPTNYVAFTTSPSYINMESNQVEQQMSFNQSPEPVIQESSSNIVDQIDEQETNNNTVTTKAEAKAAKNRNKNKNRVIVADNSGEPVVKFKCDPCNKFFNRACYLTQHNRSFHSGDKPHKCTLCGKRFGVAKKYQEHWRKHAGEKPYKCEQCPKQFNHKTDLRRHMCLHTGEKPFECEICNKGFIRKDHMVKHELTHAKKALNQDKKTKVKKNSKKVKQIEFLPEVSPIM